METKLLSKKVTSILQNPNNEIFISALSFWEISIKYSLDKLKLENVNPEDLPRKATDIGFKLLSLHSDETANYHHLKSTWHKDPFDRMLITVAIKNNFILISKDKDFAKYKEKGLKVFW